MAFLYPSFLFALAAIAIPIIIHLFNFRRYKTVYFTNTRFLKEVKEQTDSRSQLKHLLILLCRILAIVFLVLAFAQPYIKRGTVTETAGKKTTGIFIDNSFSMGQTVSDVPLLEIAKKKALELVSASNDDNLFQILTNDFEGKQQRLVDKQEAINTIKETAISPATRTIAEVIQRQKEALSKGSTQKNSFILSDFQKSFSNLNGLKPDTAFHINLVPLHAPQTSNLYIDTCWFQSPVQMINQTAAMFVRIVNNSGSSIKGGRLTLKVNDKIKAIKEFSIDANGTKTDTLSFSVSDKGWNKAEIALADHPVTFDDNYFLTYNVAEKLNVMVINEDIDNPYLNALFSKSDFFLLSNVFFNQLNYADIFKNQFVVLNSLKQLSSGLSSQLKTYLENGGNICIFPDSNSDINTYNIFLQSINSDVITSWSKKEKTVTEINNNDPVFSNVFQHLSSNITLPKSNSSFLFSKLTSTNALPLLTNNDGSDFLKKYFLGKGIFYLFSIPLNKNASDLPLNALFAPMLYNMAIIKSSTGVNAYVIGNTNMAVVDVDEKDNESVFKLIGDGKQFIPSQRKSGGSVNVFLDHQISNSGFYTLQEESNKVQAVFGMNYNRKESDLSFLSNDELKNFARPIQMNVIQNADRDLGLIISGQKLGLPLWKVSIIFALIFIALEIALLKLWK